MNAARRPLVLRVALLTGSVALLEAASRAGWIDPVSFIPPSEMFMAAVQILTQGRYTTDILLTLGSAVAAIVLAVVVGFLGGLLLARQPRVRRVVDPLLMSWYAVPIFVFYPMLIVILGLNRWPLIALGFLFSVVAMAVNTLNGVERIPRVQLRTARMLRMGPVRTTLKVRLRASLPFVFTGVKLTIVYSFIAIIGGEFLLSGAGFGYQIAFAYNNFDNPTMYGLMLILLVFVGTVNMILHAVEHRLYQRRVMKEAV